MDKYLRYGLVLLAFSIIVSKLVSLVFLFLRNYPELATSVGYVSALGSFARISAGLIAGLAGIVIIVEGGRTEWDIRKVAMTFLGFTLILVGAYSVLFFPVLNRLLAGVPGAADGYTIAVWVRNVFSALAVIAAVLILVSLQEEGAVARMGFFLYSIVTIAGVGFQFFGMEGNLGIGLALALLGIVAAVFLLKRI
jgi:hypothetical protein